MTIRASTTAALTCLAFALSGPVRAEEDTYKVGMNAKAYLAECEKGVEYWCSNQINKVAVKVMVDQMVKHEPSTFCLPKRGSGTSAERNAKVVAAVKQWFAQHPDELDQKSDASVPILKAIVALWPGACPT